MITKVTHNTSHKVREGPKTVKLPLIKIGLTKVHRFRGIVFFKTIIYKTTESSELLCLLKYSTLKLPSYFNKTWKKTRVSLLSNVLFPLEGKNNPGSNRHHRFDQSDTPLSACSTSHAIATL